MLAVASIDGIVHDPKLIQLVVANFKLHLEKIAHSAIKIGATRAMKEPENRNHQRQSNMDTQWPGKQGKRERVGEREKKKPPFAWDHAPKRNERGEARKRRRGGDGAVNVRGETKSQAAVSRVVGTDEEMSGTIRRRYQGKTQ